MRKFITIILLIIGISIGVKSQNIPCLNTISDDQKAFENTWVQSILKVSQVNRKMGIVVYVIGNRQKNYEYDATLLNEAIDGLNHFYSIINLNFSIEKVVNLDNYRYGIINSDSLINELSRIHYTNHFINLYIVDKILDTIGSYDGTSSMASQPKDYIILTRKSLSSFQLIHQTGHLFNLYHTHELAFGRELVERSGCTDKGDQCCDTEADPNLLNLVNPKCDFSDPKKSPENQFYRPRTNNYQSFTLPECACEYTQEQWLRIINCIINYKQSLW